MELREQATVINQLTFSTERKYMATLVDSPIQKKRDTLHQRCPEIVMSKCTLSDKVRLISITNSCWLTKIKLCVHLVLAITLIPEERLRRLCRTG